MRVGDKHVRHLEKVPGREIPKVSEVKENSTPFIRKRDEKPWISPRGVD
jgi:hypothetical protein